MIGVWVFNRKSQKGVQSRVQVVGMRSGVFGENRSQNRWWLKCCWGRSFKGVVGFVPWRKGKKENVLNQGVGLKVRKLK